MPSEAEVRRKLRDDFLYWCPRVCKIRTKDAQVRPLVLNLVQRRFVDLVIKQLVTTGKVRMVVLKARQQGLSTVIHALIYWWQSQHQHTKGLVLAHKADSTRALFDMYKRTHKLCPDQLRPSTSFSSRKELVFDRLDSGLMVATAGGDGIARGETYTHVHRSEVAFWPAASAEENMNALDQALSGAAGTMDFMESTANGYNLFHEQWNGAVEGTNGYTPFFSPWFETPEYQEPLDGPLEHTIEETELAERVKQACNVTLSDEQLLWRRRRIGKNGRELFMQEYPAFPEEAFLASGRPVFDPEQLQPMLDAAPQPLCRMAVEEGLVREHSVGELLVYQPLDVAGTYTIGADVAMGVRGGDGKKREGDFSVAQVLDGDKNQVATWRGHIHPDEFARVLAALGRYYNTALIAPERNNHGLLTCVKLWKDLLYPNVYMDVTEGQIADRDTINIGFATTVKTKPLIIDRLRAAVRDSDIKIVDRATLQEMRTFIVTESGQLEAETGCHDDCVMALAIAHHVHVRGWKPITVTDDFYVKAI